jgi:hypothetical protein
MPWLPISLAPYDTMTTALTLLPPLALLVGMFRLRSWRGEWMLLAVLVGTAISILLGMLQVTSGDGSWYFYLRTNIGVAVGTFANGNHLATLLLAAVPLLVAFALGRWRGADKPQQRSLTLTLTVASGAVLVIGIVVNGSAAILLIGPPVVVATAMLAMRLSPRRMAQGLLGIVALLGNDSGRRVRRGTPGLGHPSLRRDARVILVDEPARGQGPRARRLRRRHVRKSLPSI